MCELQDLLVYIYYKRKGELHCKGVQMYLKFKYVLKENKRMHANGSDVIGEHFLIVSTLSWVL